ncbi:class I SAM-dependent methyltransferase [Amycolatopsis sp. OK19-0408]|uniref:Class I SAM-dependent methyltransferase n=1 Tax=Amycolatopsis iheyensis TaxID=2945988 RepID=A0A9X2NI43_9PSEU|nr:class I SAM-dependent methyltransferase [Amycolatopsis iheyensis]MCR6488263.1 class I SAM-dependent methyltransferase [Amycolatopsis iheyensis]
MSDPHSPESAAQLYDAIGETYEAAFGQQPGLTRVLDALVRALPLGVRVLDLGSGTGRPVAATLAAGGHAVTGYDVSERMVNFARAHVPDARFEVGDMRSLSFGEGSWDAALTVFSLLQLPHADQLQMLERISQWLAPGGYFLAATVPHPAGCGGRESDWMGHRVRTYSFTALALKEHVAAAGLQVLHEEVVSFVPASDEADAEEQVYLIARKPDVA